SPDFQFSLERELKKLAQYRLRSLTNYRDEILDDWAREAGLQLPDGPNPQSIKLAQQWHREGLSDREMVNRSLNYFRDKPFWYSRRPPPLGDNPVDEFLFESRRGFCEHYAASFVTLMRAAGIPARVIIGYQGGELNSVGPLGDYLIVRQSDAHAWAEVWLDGQGWVRVDPTAVIPPSRVEWVDDSLRFESTAASPITSEQIAWLVKGWRSLRSGWDAANNSWNYWVVGFNKKRQRELLEQLGLGRLNWQQLGLMLTGLVALLLGGVALLLLYRRQRVDPMVRLYRRFCQKFNKIEIIYKASETPEQFANRVVAIRPELAKEVMLITEIYYQLRYRPAASLALRGVFRERIRAFRVKRL
ncbi:MAG: transglutaminase domain-containing protein, partial [Chromatiales bacterium]|nr:transglutaminase domain-containing protein [Chromatiales bacterium]